MPADKIKTKESSDTTAILYSSIIFLTIGFLAVILACQEAELSLGELYNEIINNLFVPHYSNLGGFMVGDIAGGNILVPFYFLVLILGGLMYFTFRFFFNPLKKELNTTFPKIVTILCFLTFFSFLPVQLSRNIKHIEMEKQIYMRKGGTEKSLELLYGPSYAFGTKAKQILPDGLGVELWTDKPLNEDPYMSAQRSLAYFIYPKLSLRFNHKDTKDVIILFYKDNPTESVPPGYTIVGHTNEKKMYLLIKNSLVHELKPL